MPRAWTRFWFRESETAGFDLGVCRIVFCLGALLYVVVGTQDLARWAEVDSALAQWPANSWMEVFHLPRFSLEVYRGALLTWYCALLLAGIGLFTRTACAVAVGGGLLFCALRATIYQAHHEDSVLIFVLIALATSPCGERLSLDAKIRSARGKEQQADSRWQHASLQLVRVLLAIIASFSGVAKLRNTGLDWVFGDVFPQLLSFSQVTGWIYFQPIVRIPTELYGHNSIFVALAATTVAVELLYPLAFRGGRWMIIPGTFALMLVTFRLVIGPSMVLVLLAHTFWIPWTRWSRTRRTG